MKRILVGAVLAGALAALVAGPAAAHKQKLPARTLVEQAIALLRTQPEQQEAIEDAIHDALESRDKRGVNLDLVRRADEAFEAGRIHETWDLLEEAIGAAPHRVVQQPNPAPGLPAPEAELAAEAEPVLHERAELGGLEAPRSTAGWVLIAIALATATAGTFVVLRVR